jgi:hypothetical protein
MRRLRFRATAACLSNQRLPGKSPDEGKHPEVGVECIMQRAELVTSEKFFMTAKSLPE